VTPPVKYQPGRASCRVAYWASGSFDPYATLLTQELSGLPGWLLEGEDGTEVSIWREADELIGFVKRRDGSKAHAYGDGDGCDGPIVARGDSWPEPTEIELRVINRVLRPVALERPWDELVAEMEPCEHDHAYCVRTQQHEETP